MITGASPSPKNKTVCLCAVMIPLDFFHGPVVYTKPINQLTCWTFDMLPTLLSPVTVDNQYIVSRAATFSIICCVPDIPSDGVTNDITLETLLTGPCSPRVVRTAGTGYRLDEGPANAQRRQLALKMQGGNLKIKPHTPTKFCKFHSTCFIQIPTELSPSPEVAILLRDYSAQ